MTSINDNIAFFHSPVGEWNIGGKTHGLLEDGSEVRKPKYSVSNLDYRSSGNGAVAMQPIEHSP